MIGVAFSGEACLAPERRRRRPTGPGAAGAANERPPGFRRSPARIVSARCTQQSGDAARRRAAGTLAHCGAVVV